MRPKPAIGDFEQPLQYFISDIYLEEAATEERILEGSELQVVLLWSQLSAVCRVQKVHLMLPSDDGRVW